MKKAFMCSLCRSGILGGGLYLDNQSVTYRTQKLTAGEKYKIIIFNKWRFEKCFQEYSGN